MTITNIQNGELGSSVRSKLNAAIQEANKVSGKQDASGLGSAAFESTDAFDPAGSAQEAEDFAVQRENHTGTQELSTISDAGTAASRDAVEDEDDETPESLVDNARLAKIVGTLLPPGPQDFIGGDMSAGFFGEVDSSELFTPLELDFLLGFTEGESMSDAGWLKFARNGKILYVQKRPMRHSISWDHIYSRGAVYGVNGEGAFPRGTPTNQYRPLRKGNFTLVPRLLTGAASDPIDTTEIESEESCTFDLGSGSEWNDLIYRVHQDEPFCGDPDHDTLHGGPQVGNNWASYSSADLGVVSGSGRGTWCQETSSDSTSFRVNRGFTTSVAHFNRGSASSAGSALGLRLVLQLES